MDDREQGRIAQGRGLELLVGLEAAEEIKSFLAANVQPGGGNERLKGIPQASFPIDQRAIAIECQRLEIAQLHVRSSLQSGKTSASGTPCDEPKLRPA